MVKARIECSLNEADFNNYAMSNLFAAWLSGKAGDLKSFIPVQIRVSLDQSFLLELAK